jgi:hypothetical protein
MVILIITFFILVALGSLYFAPVLRKFQDDHTQYVSYSKKEHLLSDTEREFFRVLTEVVGDEYHIVPKLQLSQLVQVERERRWEYAPMDKTYTTSVDFALFYKETLSPRLVIELDENSHGTEHAPAKNNFSGEVLGKVGIRVVHIQASPTYNTDDMAKLLL